MSRGGLHPILLLQPESFNFSLPWSAWGCASACHWVPVFPPGGLRWPAWTLCVYTDFFRGCRIPRGENRSGMAVPGAPTSALPTHRACCALPPFCSKHPIRISTHPVCHQPPSQPLCLVTRGRPNSQPAVPTVILIRTVLRPLGHIPPWELRPPGQQSPWWRRQDTQPAGAGDSVIVSGPTRRCPPHSSDPRALMVGATPAAACPWVRA